VFFSLDYFAQSLDLLLLCSLVVAGFTAVGTLASAISVRVRGRDIILPLILFPVCLPLIAAAVHLTRELLLTEQLLYGDFWFILICALDVISITVSWLLFEYVVKD